MLGSHFAFGTSSDSVEVCRRCRSELGDGWELDELLESDRRCNRCGMPPVVARLRKKDV